MYDKILIKEYLTAVYELYCPPQYALGNDSPEPSNRTIEASMLLETQPEHLNIKLQSDMKTYIPNTVYTLTSDDFSLDKILYQRLINLRMLIDKDSLSASRGVILLTLKDQDIRIPCELRTFSISSDVNQLWNLYKMPGAFIDIDTSLIKKMEVVVMTTPRAFRRETKLRKTAHRNLMGQSDTTFNPDLI